MGTTLEEVNYDRLQNVVAASGMQDREIAALEMLVRLRPSLPVSECAGVASVVRAAIDILRGGGSYMADALASVVLLFRNPFMPYAPVDAAKASEGLIDIIRSLGILLLLPYPLIQRCAAKVLREFAPGGTHGDASWASAVVQSSGTVTAACDALRREDNPEVLFDLLVALRALAVVDAHAATMSGAGVLELGIQIISKDVRSAAAEEALSLLCSVLERHSDSAAQLGSWHALTLLKESLTTLLSVGHSLRDRMMRNDLLVLANLLADEPANSAAFAESSLLNLCLLLATSRELRIENELVRPFIQGFEPAEVEMIRLAWGIVGACVGDDAACQHISEASFAACLLLHIDVQNSYETIVGWSPQQTAMLREAALMILRTAGTKLADNIVHHDGARILLAYAMDDIGWEDVHALAPLVAVAAAEFAREPIVEANGVEILLAIARDSDRNSVTRRDALAALSLLCTNNVEALERFDRAGGVAVVSPYLQPVPASDEAREDFLLVSVDTLWQCIAPREESLIQLMQSDGYMAVLDLLALRAPLLTPILLSCLADMLDAPDADLTMKAWRGTNEKSLGHLLLTMWIEEDNRYGVGALQTGVLADPAFPLVSEERLGKLQLIRDGPRDAMHPQSRQQLLASASGIDLRTKIFVLLSRIGFNCWDDLTPTLQSRSYVAANYLQLRDGLLWRNVQYELSSIDQIRPISPDQELIREGIASAVDIAHGVQEMQHEVMLVHREEAQLREKEFVRTIIAAKSDEDNLRSNYMQRLKSQPSVRRKPQTASTMQSTTLSVKSATSVKSTTSGRSATSPGARVTSPQSAATKSTKSSLSQSRPTATSAIAQKTPTKQQPAVTKVTRPSPTSSGGRKNTPELDDYLQDDVVAKMTAKLPPQAYR
eukprot:TRINITY_DN3597_c0_g1_i1.p1 TRINITY_DN3597_c0_g1~~TRINITY_DN3597_c0_g1_i1.p1  ORF type:complete len:890 (+),score=209.89 TRINITY_DN3597_c0_g1_i1:46-2715(+)